MIERDIIIKDKNGKREIIKKKMLRKEVISLIKEEKSSTEVKTIKIERKKILRNNNFLKL